MILGALEAGGTKMVCAIGDELGNIYDRKVIQTESPDITIPKILAYFADKKMDALGIGTFGPVDLNRESLTYGHILKGAKLSWNQYNLLGTIKEELRIPVGIDTDVNSSVLGEVTYGIGKGLQSVLYITVGTGIGIGVYVNGSLLHGMLHPEGGHILLNRHKDDTYGGICPFHKNCFEGFASGPAIEERAGKKAYEISKEDKVWEIEAYYIAEALVSYILILAPQKIILGGGVMHQEQLFPMIRSKVLRLLNSYLLTDEIKDIDNYIVKASLNENQGILGCFQIAKNELDLTKK